MSKQARAIPFEQQGSEGFKVPPTPGARHMRGPVLRAFCSLSFTSVLV